MPERFELGTLPYEQAHLLDGLAAVGVNAPAGNFYAIEASRRLGLGTDGAVRVGLAAYSTTEEVDRLLAGLSDLAA